MNRIGLTLILSAALLGPALLAGCGEQEGPAESKPAVGAKDVQKEAKEALEAAAAFAEQKRQEYSEKLSAELESFDKKIDELDAKAEAMEEKARSELKKKVEELRERQQVVARRFEEMDTVSEKAWKELKPKVDAALQDLREAYKEAAPQEGP